MQRRNAKTLTLVPRRKQRPACSARPCLWIRTAAGPSIGFGHLRRSLNLAHCLDGSIRAIFLLEPDDVWSPEQVSREGFLYALTSGAWWDSVPSPTALLVDTREREDLETCIAEARRRRAVVISIHDLGLNPVDSDIAIDGSLCADFSGFPRKDAAFYSGSPYLVLESSYGFLHRQKKRIRETLQQVVINLGGGCSKKYFRNILEGLRLAGRELDVSGIYGFTEWGQEELSSYDWHPLRFSWIRRSIEKTTFRADIAFTAGGLSAFEALCAGTPVLALSLDCFQQKTISTLAQLNACIDLGSGDSLRPSHIPGVLPSLDRNSREDLSLHGRRLVDGQGAERVASIIREVIAAHCSAEYAERIG